MRTVDIVVTGFFSPAAVAAIGLADLYSDVPRRVGSALGAGAIAIASQDTGRDAAKTRNRAITQALLLGFVFGLPFIMIGILFSQFLIALLGAVPDVVQLGGTYLMIVFAIGPMRIVGYVGAAALQGTGDTQTPMYVNGAANILNIGGTIGLGLGIGPFPALGIIGVGLATAISRTLEAGLVLLAIWSDRTIPFFAKPRSINITRQIIWIGAPRFAEQMSRSIASFPFNALLLIFGTEVNAAYHIAKRLYRQLVGPIYRSLSTVSSIIVGQKLGENDPLGARFAGFAIATLGIIVMVPAGALLYVTAENIVFIFSNDPHTIHLATDFTRVFAVSMTLFGILFSFVGGLRGAGDTRIPFYAAFTSQFGFMLGFSYLTAIVLGYGLIGIYLGIILAFLWRTLIVTGGFVFGDWADIAADMISERREESGTDR